MNIPTKLLGDVKALREKATTPSYRRAPSPLSPMGQSQTPLAAAQPLVPEKAGSSNVYNASMTVPPTGKGSSVGQQSIKNDTLTFRGKNLPPLARSANHGKASATGKKGGSEAESSITSSNHNSEGVSLGGIEASCATMLYGVEASEECKQRVKDKHDAIFDASRLRILKRRRENAMSELNNVLHAVFEHYNPDHLPPPGADESVDASHSMANSQAKPSRTAEKLMDRWKSMTKESVKQVAGAPDPEMLIKMARKRPVTEDELQQQRMTRLKARIALGKSSSSVLIPTVDELLILLGDERLSYLTENRRKGGPDGSTSENDEISFQHSMALQVQWLVEEVGKARERADIGEERYRLILREMAVTEQLCVKQQAQLEDTAEQLRVTSDTLYSDRRDAVTLKASLDAQLKEVRLQLKSQMAESEAADKREKEASKRLGDASAVMVKLKQALITIQSEVQYHTVRSKEAVSEKLEAEQRLALAQASVAELTEKLVEAEHKANMVTISYQRNDEGHVPLLIRKGTDQEGGETLFEPLHVELSPVVVAEGGASVKSLLAINPELTTKENGAAAAANNVANNDRQGASMNSGGSFMAEAPSVNLLGASTLLVEDSQMTKPFASASDVSTSVPLPSFSAIPTHAASLRTASNNSALSSLTPLAATANPSAAKGLMSGSATPLAVVDNPAEEEHTAIVIDELLALCEEFENGSPSDGPLSFPKKSPRTKNNASGSATPKSLPPATPPPQQATPTTTRLTVMVPVMGSSLLATPKTSALFPLTPQQHASDTLNLGGYLATSTALSTTSNEGVDPHKPPSNTQHADADYLAKVESDRQRYASQFVKVKDIAEAAEKEVAKMKCDNEALRRENIELATDLIESQQATEAATHAAHQEAAALSQMFLVEQQRVGSEVVILQNTLETALKDGSTYRLRCMRLQENLKSASARLVSMHNTMLSAPSLQALLVDSASCVDMESATETIQHVTELSRKVKELAEEFSGQSAFVMNTSMTDALEEIHAQQTALQDGTAPPLNPLRKAKSSAPLPPPFTEVISNHSITNSHNSIGSRVTSARRKSAAPTVDEELALQGTHSATLVPSSSKRNSTLTAAGDPLMASTSISGDTAARRTSKVMSISPGSEAFSAAELSGSPTASILQTTKTDIVFRKSPLPPRVTTSTIGTQFDSAVIPSPQPVLIAPSAKARLSMAQLPKAVTTEMAVQCELIDPIAVARAAQVSSSVSFLPSVTSPTTMKSDTTPALPLSRKASNLLPRASSAVKATGGSIVSTVVPVSNVVAVPAIVNATTTVTIAKNPTSASSANAPTSKGRKGPKSPPSQRSKADNKSAKARPPLTSNLPSPSATPPPENLTLPNTRANSSIDMTSDEGTSFTSNGIGTVTSVSRTDDATYELESGIGPTAAERLKEREAEQQRKEKAAAMIKKLEAQTQDLKKRLETAGLQFRKELTMGERKRIEVEEKAAEIRTAHDAMQLQVAQTLFERQELLLLLDEAKKKIQTLQETESRDWILDKNRRFLESGERAIKQLQTAVNATLCNECLEPVAIPIAVYPCGHLLCEKCFLLAQHERKAVVPPEVEAAIRGAIDFQNKLDIFSTRSLAEGAVAPIVQPFMSKHSRFCSASLSDKDLFYCPECSSFTGKFFTHMKRIDEITSKITSVKRAMEEIQTSMKLVVTAEDSMLNRPVAGAGKTQQPSPQNIRIGDNSDKNRPSFLSVDLTLPPKEDGSDDEFHF